MCRILALLLAVPLGGCVGLVAIWETNDKDDAPRLLMDSSKHPAIWKSRASTSEYREKNGAPTRVERISEGEELWVYEKDMNQWCGATVWLVVPIPFMLPLCDEETEIRFVADQAVEQTYSGTDSTGFVCSPLLRLANSGLHMHSDDLFCSGPD